MAVKTILIGLGSFGHDVCDVLASRIEAEVSDLGRVPWLKFMVYETEQQTNSLVARRGLVNHMGIDASTWQTYLGNPGNYDPTLDFSTWADSSIRDVMMHGGVPTNGANNTRPTGRICFMNQSNLSEFQAGFLAHFHSLREMTSADAKKAMGLKSDELRFAKQGPAGPDTIQVMVIGSLAGGTNSGCFIDVGYYLQTLPGVGDQLDIQGIFAIPDASYTSSAHWANVYAGLTELNHFIGGRPYHAKFADRHKVTVSHTAPFSRVHLVQSISGAANPSASLGPIINSISELLHLIVVSDPEENITKKIGDGLGVYAGERDLDGRPMAYASLGASVVLFPVDHILDGLSSRLAGEGLGDILVRREPSESEKDRFASQLRVDEQSYQDKLLANAKVQDYLVGLGEETMRAAMAALKGDTSARDNIKVRIRNGIASASQASSQNFQGEFRSPIFDVCKELENERLKDLDRIILEALQNPSQGLYWSDSVLKGFLADCEMRLRELDNPKTDIGVRAEAQASIDRAGAIERQMSEKPGCNPFAKKPDPKKLSQQWATAMGEEWRTGILIKSEEFEKAVLKSLSERAKLLMERLDHSSNGLIQFMKGLKAMLDSTFTEHDKAGPVVNGLCLFEAHKTLGEEWQKNLPSPEAADRCRGEIRRACRSWFVEILKDRNLSAFDRKKEADWRDQEILQLAGREFFPTVKSETIERRLLSWPNWQDELAKAARLGKAFVSIEASRNQLGIPAVPEGLRRPAYIYFHDPTASVGESGQIVAELKRRQLPLNHWADQHRILFSEGLTVFAPYSIKGVADAEPKYEAKNRTRADIAWQKLSGKPLDEHERYQVGLILAAASLGIVQLDNGTNLQFTTQNTNMHNSRSLILCRNRDLIDASYHLGLDKVAAKDLRDQVEKTIHEAGATVAAKKIDSFNAGVDELMLIVGRRNVDKQEAFLRELEFLRTIPNLITAMLDLYPAFDPNDGNWELHPETENRQSAWRCNRCKQWLGSGTTVTPPDGLPEICPNPDCSQQIRYDRILGLR